MRLRLLLSFAGLPVLLVVAWFRVRAGVPLRKALIETIFGLYMLAVASMVFLPVYLDPATRAAHAESAARFGTGWFSPVPFRTIGALLRRSTSTQLGLAAENLVLLLPFGLLAPAAFRRLRDWRLFLAISISTAVLIEVGQLLERVARLAFRSVDIDDVILNTLGALIGFAILAVLASVSKRAGRRRKPDVAAPPVEQAFRADGASRVD